VASLAMLLSSIGKHSMSKGASNNVSTYGEEVIEY
jgi:hypothetical protein